MQPLAQQVLSRYPKTWGRNRRSRDRWRVGAECTVSWCSLRLQLYLQWCWLRLQAHTVYSWRMNRVCGKPLLEALGSSPPYQLHHFSLPSNRLERSGLFSLFPDWREEATNMQISLSTYWIFSWSSGIWIYSSLTLETKSSSTLQTWDIAWTGDTQEAHAEHTGSNTHRAEDRQDPNPKEIWNLLYYIV